MVKKDRILLRVQRIEGTWPPKSSRIDAGRGSPQGIIDASVNGRPYFFPVWIEVIELAADVVDEAAALKTYQLQLTSKAFARRPSSTA